MTRKDYVAISRVFHDEMDSTKSVEAVDAICCLAQALADVMEADNPDFEPNRFLDACGVT